MDRTSALDYLTGQYAELANYAKFTSDQTTAAYTTAIDMSLRLLDYGELDLASADVNQANVLKYLALLDYFALDRFAKLLSIQYDVTLPGPLQAARSQAFKNVMMLKTQAEMRLATLGIDIGASSGSSMKIGRLTLDFLEPSSAARREF
jgi:hypothetical protein